MKAKLTQKKVWEDFGRSPHTKMNQLKMLVGRQAQLTHFQLKSIQNYAKQFQHPSFKGGKVFLANLEKNPTYYETGYFILILFCRIN